MNEQTRQQFTGAPERLRERNRQLLAENAALRQQLCQQANGIASFSLRIYPGAGWRWWYARILYPNVLLNAGPLQILFRCRPLLDWLLFRR